MGSKDYLATFWNRRAKVHGNQLQKSKSGPREPRHEKTCLCHMRTTKAQISLRNRAVRSAPLLFAAWIV